MRFDQLTLKAQEIIQNAQQVAERKGHQQIEPEHVLRAILDQRDHLSIFLYETSQTRDA